MEVSYAEGKTHSYSVEYAAAKVAADATKARGTRVEKRMLSNTIG